MGTVKGIVSSSQEQDSTLLGVGGKEDSPTCATPGRHQGPAWISLPDCPGPVRAASAPRGGQGSGLLAWKPTRLPPASARCAHPARGPSALCHCSCLQRGVWLLCGCLCAPRAQGHSALRCSCLCGRLCASPAPRPLDCCSCLPRGVCCLCAPPAQGRSALGCCRLLPQSPRGPWDRLQGRPLRPRPCPPETPRSQCWTAAGAGTQRG